MNKKTEQDWKNLQEAWKDFFGTTTPQTEIVCETEEGGLVLIPAETNQPGDTFYHMDSVVDFCRVYHISHYVTWNDEENRIEVHIFK